MMRYVVTYDIADDRRREDVATLLSGYGPRVQLSVFECDLRTRREAAALQAKLRELIDPVEDQVRLYPLDERAAGRSCDRREGDRGTAGLLDRHMSRYRHLAEAAFSGPGWRTRSPWSAAWRRGEAGIWPLGGCVRPDGWRNSPQRCRSQVPPNGIRRKAQPDTEGIETPV